MKRFEGYSPSHITQFFSIEDQSDQELLKGSRGAGFCLEAGVTTRVTIPSVSNQLSQPEISINGQPTPDAPVSLALLQLVKETTSVDPALLNLQVEHRVDLPQGSGFGTSGAGALSLSHALNRALKLNFTPEDCAQLAHRAEIRARTGLGTIAGEYLGGIEIRKSAGAPGVAEIVPVDYPSDLRCRIWYFGKVLTAGALRDPEIRSAVIEAGNRAMDQISSKSHWEGMMELASQFTSDSGLLTAALAPAYHQLKDAGIASAVLMFGNGLYFLYRERDKENIDKTVNQIEKMGYIEGGCRYDLALDPLGGRELS